MSERAFYPTRLIKISAYRNRLQLRLIHKRDMEEHDTSRYVALSYRWGGDQPWQLTQERDESYRTEIPWDTLPRTIQDAAITVQSLGFYYLWVDSMCIIQNSEVDKAVEINQMTKVYAHATLTIMDKRGERVTDGFLHPRTLPSGTSSMKLRTEPGQTQDVTLTFEDAWEKGDNLILNTRGWIMQEYILSRRLLIFGTWLTEWRCRRESRVHTDGWMINNHDRTREGDPFAYYGGGWTKKESFESEEAESVYKSHFVHVAMFISVNPGYWSGQMTEHMVDRYWDSLVESYSARSVTNAEDRIFAISGVAERFADIIPGRYIAGNWERMMPKTLFWRSHTLSKSDRPTEYQGPSWSWISIRDEIAFQANNNCMCTVLSIEYELKTAGALYGALSSATLHIKGPALSVEWQYTRQGQTSKEDLSEFWWKRQGKDDGQDPLLEINLDAREQTTKWENMVLLAHQLFEHEGSRSTDCVALVWVDQIDVDKKPRDRYRRVGIVTFSTFGWASPLPRVESWSERSYYVI